MLQQRLNVKLAQRQVLTPGLVQMVGVLALNNLELKDMINNELVENPVLEEIEAAQETLEQRTGREGDRERSAEDVAGEAERPKSDPFDEVDFGSYFQDYLDPGFRTPSTFEEYDKPSFEQFLTKPRTLSDHLLWQVGAMTLPPAVRAAVELMIGNLNEDGYLTASDEEILTLGGANLLGPCGAGFSSLVEARRVLFGLDPVGVGARHLAECLLVQIAAVRPAIGPTREAAHEVTPWELAETVVREHLALLQRRDLRELARLCRQSVEEVQRAVDAIRRLDPRPGQRFNGTETRLIEPDVAFVKRDDEFVVVMNDEGLPSLRLNQGYRRMMKAGVVEREVRDYVKERYRSAIQLLRNLEQRKNTILRTCEVIVQRQGEFLERGVDGLRPMMIKEVAEEIGVHPSTVSRAVANKYVHTQQGVYELRFFFSEGVNGPEGGDLPLPLLKRKVKKLIEEEDARKPLTDDALTAELLRQGIQVTRRTVAKYREEMGIPSTHQRRRR